MDELFYTCFTCFDLRQTRSFSATDPFLTTIIMLKNEMGSCVRIGGEGFEKSYVPLHGGRGVKNCHNHPYVINE